MADFSNIYNEIDANVNANGQQKITGPILNKTLKDMLQEVDSEKQDTLVAGQNIQINGNVISATGGGGGQEYYAGDGITINDSNEISVNRGAGLTTTQDGRLDVDFSEVQEKLQAGSNITIYGNTISATDTNTTYSAGQGLELNGTTFAVKAGSGLGFDANGNLVNTGGGGGGTTYTAGSGIDIDSNNVISAKAGPGLLVDPSTNNIELDRSALNFLPLEGGILQDTTPANDTTLTVMDGMNEDYVRIVAPETQGAPHVEIFENGSGDTKFYYDRMERGTQTTINYPTQSGTLALTSDIPYAPVYSGGNAIDIDASTNAISVNYSGGGLYLDGNNQLAVDYNSIPGNIAGNGLQDDGNGQLEVDFNDVQGKLVAGSNIQINGNVISATDTNTTYSAGSGLNLNGTTFSVDTTAIQEKLTAGQNITISGNVISAAGGSGATYSAGQGINIDQNNEISVKASDIAGPCMGTLTNGRLFVDTVQLATILPGDGLKTNGTRGEIDVDFNDVQEKLVAGNNIQINGNVISATGGGSGNYLPLTGGQLQGVYTGGIDSTALDISSPNNYSSINLHANDNSFAATGKATIDMTDSDGQKIYGTDGISDGTYTLSFPTLSQNEIIATQSDVNTAVSGKQDTLTAGSGISIVNNVISATGGGGSSYSAGNGIDITNNTISVDATDLDGTGLTTNQNGELEVDTNVIQGKLTAGTGISIQGNVISATGGGGSGLWTSGTGTGSVMSPGAFQANGNNSVSAGDYTRSNGTSSIALGTSTTTTGLSSVAIGANSTAAGSYSVALGHGLGAVNTDETALGKFNNYIDTGTTAEKTFFTVGNGTSNNTKSNVLEIKQNDDIYVSGVGGFNGTNASSADTLQDVIAGKQDTLVAGANITISGNVISATGGGGGSYTASHGIDIINDAISVDVSDLDGTGLIADHQRGILEVDFTTVQEKLTAGSGITISGNTISATGGGSGNYLPLTGGQLQANPSDAETLLDVAAPDSTAAVSISADTIDSKLAISADKANAGISDGDTFRTVFTNTGEIQVSAKTVNPLDPTDIGETSYTLVLPQKNDTIATLSDIQGGGSSYTAGAGINIDANNAISSTTFVPGTGQNSVKSPTATNASASNAIAIGNQASALGVSSVAIGQSSNTSAGNAIALGLGAYARNSGEIALGENNLPTDSGTTAQKTKFTVGNGSWISSTRSNLIEAKQNNDIYVYGVGGFNGTNAGQSGVETLQQAIANAGGGGTSYTAGQAIDITNGAISVDYGNGLGLGTNGELQVEWSEGPTALAGSGLSANTQNGQLDVDFTSVQGKLTAGSGISIQNNVISATGGGSGSCLWSSGTGQDSLVSPGAAASSYGSDASGIGSIVIGEDSNANGDYSFAHGQGSMANGDYSAAFVNSNSTGDYSFAAGSGADAQADYSVALGGGIVVSDNSDPENPIDALRGVAIGEGATVNGVCGLAFMGGTATGEYSVAVGDSANANEMYSTALTGSTASGNYSFAASSGVANAHYSTALSGAEAFGEGAFAAGQGNKAYGYGAAALGYMAQTYTQADGTDVSDPNAGEVALGRYNYSEQGIVFTVGCGYLDETDPNNPVDVRQNAVAIDSDGKIFLKGLGGYTGTSTSGCTDLVSFLNNL